MSDIMDPDMWAVQLNHDELAHAFKAERLYWVRYEPFECRPSRKARITCTYLMDTRLRQIEGYSPIESGFGLGFREDRINRLSFPWLNIGFDPGGFHPAEFESFVRWLKAEHPEAGGPLDRGELFRTEGQELIHILTRKSVDLLAGYLEEYERSRSRF